MNESQKALGNLIAFANRYSNETTKQVIAPSLVVIKNLVDRDKSRKIEFVVKSNLGSVFQCPNCYHQVGTSSNFCKHCGQRLGSIDDE
jgi:hypothetical protein